MSFDPRFQSCLDPEVLAFMHIAGIELRPNLHGNLMPIIRFDGFDWVCWLPRPERFGGYSSMEFWKEVAKQAHGMKGTRAKANDHYLLPVE